MTQSKQNGGPAFPSTHDRSPCYVGMTLRDWFAGQALAGMMANCDSNGMNWWIGEEGQLAGYAYKAADAMLEART